MLEVTQERAHKVSIKVSPLKKSVENNLFTIHNKISKPLTDRCRRLFNEKQKEAEVNINLSMNTTLSKVISSKSNAKIIIEEAVNQVYKPNPSLLTVKL